jgi:arginase
MLKQNKIALLGYASGIAAGDSGTGDGPAALMTSDLQNKLAAAGVKTQWQELLYPLIADSVLATVADLCTCLAEQTRKIVEQQQLFTVFGGDHSCAIGTWSGVAAAVADKGSVGLIWIDAHMDAHTPQTSESGNIHGMPIAALLGYGAPELIQVLTPQAKIKPEHHCLIGIRSCDRGETELIKRLGVRVFYMEEVAQRGIENVMQEALSIARKAGAGYGVSIDIDGLDPRDAPGVGSPEAEGIRAIDLYCALQLLQRDPRLLGAEITEFNPHHDDNKKTEKVIHDLMLAIFK